MDEVDVDTVVVVRSDGVDHDYNIRYRPGMKAYLVPGLGEGEQTLWITIPLKKDENF